MASRALSTTHYKPPPVHEGTLRYRCIRSEPSLLIYGTYRTYRLPITGLALPGSSMRTGGREVGLRTVVKIMLTPPGGHLRKTRRGEVIPIKGPRATYMALRKPGGLPRAGDCDRAPGSGTFVSPRRPGQMSDRIYRFVTLAVEPGRRLPRPHGCGEHEGSVTARRGPDAELPGANVRLGLQDHPAAPGMRESVCYRRGRRRCVRQGMGG